MSFNQPLFFGEKHAIRYSFLWNNYSASVLLDNFACLHCLVWLWELRGLSEDIREAWSDIGVVGKKQVSLINQLIDVVKGYQESEKLVVLKVSEDVSTANAVASMQQQQSGLVMTSVSSLAKKFPELKSKEQYMQLIDSIQKCEEHLESTRQTYNAMVKYYNTHRSSIPHVFYANALKFNKAPYLEFQGGDQIMDIGSMKNFSADDDGERLNA